MSETIIILGASARAAAYSAARAGCRPWTADLFADADLARLCTATRVDRYPCGFWAAACQAPDAPWLYTGGLENYPRVIDRIAAERDLLGNRGNVLRAVRDPWQLAKTVGRAGLPFPQMATSGSGLPRDGSWLRKGLRSSGGVRVESWDADNHQPNATRGWYFQAKIAGDSYSAVYVAAGGACQLLGVTRQYVGGDGQLGSQAGAPPFHYAGSIGPIRMPEDRQAQLEQLGEALKSQFGLVGLFGVDFVYDIDAPHGGDAIWPIEVNPRYPASTEVLERALAFSAVGLHLAACRDGVLPTIASGPSINQLAGKVICYAERPLQLDAASCAALLAMNVDGDWPQVADIPNPRCSFEVGQPVVTLLADAGSLADGDSLSNGDRIDAVAAELTRRLGKLFDLDVLEHHAHGRADVDL